MDDVNDLEKIKIILKRFFFFLGKQKENLKLKNKIYFMWGLILFFFLEMNIKLKKRFHVCKKNN